MEGSSALTQGQPVYIEHSNILKPWKPGSTTSQLTNLPQQNRENFQRDETPTSPLLYPSLSTHDDKFQTVKEAIASLSLRSKDWYFDWWLCLLFLEDKGFQTRQTSNLVILMTFLRKGWDFETLQDWKYLDIGLSVYSKNSSSLVPPSRIHRGAQPTYFWVPCFSHFHEVHSHCYTSAGGFTLNPVTLLRPLCIQIFDSMGAPAG